MPTGSGLSAQIGYGEESTYGTRVAPTRFLDFRSEGIQTTFEYLESQGLRSGAKLPLASKSIRTTKACAGDIVHEIGSKGFGLLFKHMLGSVTTFTPTAGTLSRVHRAQFGPIDGKSLTVQVGKPSTNTTVNPFDYVGAKFNTWEVANDVNDLLVLTLGVEANDEKTDQTLATATYPTGEVLHYGGGLLTVAGTPSWPGALPVTVAGGTATDIKNFSLSMDQGLSLDRYFIRQNLNRKEPIEIGVGALTGTFTMEFESMTAYNRFITGGTYSLWMKWEGSTIEGAFKFAVHLLMPAVRLEGSTPTVEGPDILTVEQPFTVLNDGTNPPLTLDYVTTDTAP